MKTILSAAFALVLLASQSKAEDVDKNAECYLAVDEIDYIVGSCTITQLPSEIRLATTSVKANLKINKATNNAEVEWGGEDLGEAKSDGDNGCWVNARVRVCGWLSTTPVGYGSFKREGRCTFDYEGKSLINGDCTYFKFVDPQTDEYGEDFDQSTLIVLSDDQTVKAALVYPIEAEQKELTGTLSQMTRLGGRMLRREIGEVAGKGACWTAKNYAKLCILKGEWE